MAAHDDGHAASHEAKRVVVVSFGLVAMGVALVRNGRTVVDPDLWGHVRFGLDKIDAGRYLSFDTYSYLTGGQTWFNHEWLSEVVMAASYRWLGPGGLSALKLAVVLAVTLVVYAMALRVGLSPIRSAALTLVTTVLLAPTMGTIRPQVFSVLAMTALVVIIVMTDDGGRSFLWALPPLFLVWINLHGGVLAGVAVLVVWVAVSEFLLWRGQGRFDAKLLAIAAASVAALAVHPLGPAHFWFLLRTATGSRPEIDDWQPIDLGSGIGLAYIVIAVAVVGTVVLRRGRARWPQVIPMLALVAAPLVATRHLQLMAVSVPILGVHLLTSDVDSEPLGRSAADSVLAAALAVTLLGAGLVTNRSPGCIEIDPDQFVVPASAVAAMAAAGISGDVIVPFNWGEFVIWELAPDVEVSIDGRRETVYPSAVLETNLAFETGGPGWDAHLDQGAPQASLLAAGSPTIDRLTARGWTVRHADSVAVVISVEAGGAVASSDLPADGAGLCFPSAEGRITNSAGHGTA